ncbi:M23 family metallopeptidase [Aestuariispira insulae]|uniref:Peptidase M23-like protein n=1 Tax=Aestuariispira insulae TaxID=1461337 RepID=A0A3D9HWA8_9PROT|nr:M23 family metallopeptidase [Aestuariispira insulae]RED53690.1 peptidase M23-like protein [Aestuariispira insulae]
MSRFLAPAAGLVFLACLSSGYAQQALSLSWPVDCAPGKDCFVMKYVDMAPGEDYRDFRCNRLTNDDHKGTDIRLLDMAAMDKGVSVLAAADGVVREVRDHMPDVSSTLVSYDAVRARGYGNLVTIEHEDGTLTAYAHLKRGSILVKAGERVGRGQKLGDVGLSGLSEFPHLHFEVVRRGKRIDPFSGAALEEGCPQQANPLWSAEVVEKLAYDPVRMIHMGFSEYPLNRDALEFGLDYEGEFPAKAKNFILNLFVMGPRAGDRWEVSITREGASEPLVKASGVYEKSKLFEFQYVGKAGKGRTWDPGRYRGQYRLLRMEEGQTEPQVILRASREILIQ